VKFPAFYKDKILNVTCEQIILTHFICGNTFTLISTNSLNWQLNYSSITSLFYFNDFRRTCNFCIKATGSYSNYFNSIDTDESISLHVSVKEKRRMHWPPFGLCILNISPYLSQNKYLDGSIDLLEGRITNESQNNYIFMCV